MGERDGGGRRHDRSSRTGRSWGRIVARSDRAWLSFSRLTMRPRRGGVGIKTRIEWRVLPGTRSKRLRWLELEPGSNQPPAKSQCLVASCRLPWSGWGSEAGVRGTGKCQAAAGGLCRLRSIHPVRRKPSHHANIDGWKPIHGLGR